jgi:hypothetical protein
MYVYVFVDGHNYGDFQQVSSHSDMGAIYRPHRLLDPTNLRTFSDLFAGYFWCILQDVFAGDFAYFIGLICWRFLCIIIRVLLYSIGTNITHDTLILFMIH